MDFLSYLKLLIPFLLFCFSLSGQTKSESSCGKELQGFIYDTQEYIINSKENSTFDFVFYPGFTYRMELCTKNTRISLNLTLIDEKGNEQFKKDINYGFYRDFKFETLFHGKLQVKPITIDNQPAQIIIGYKKTKN
jgi:hypothetical protein